MDINYKAVYDIQYYVEQIKSAHREVNKAERALDTAHQQYKEACSTISGIALADLNFSNQGCMAKGVLYHVFHIVVKTNPHGHFKNKCIFCGIDNVDDIY